MVLIMTDIIYNIQQVADMTGLSKQVVRKWEERYKIVQPKRLDNGYRVYTMKEVNTIIKIKTLVDKGYSIKQAALTIEEKNNIEVTTVKESKQQPFDHSEPLDEFVLKLLHEGTLCHEGNMNRIIQQAYHSYGLKHFIERVIIPFLFEVGRRWKDGNWSEYQEALSSQVIRDYLIQIRRNFKQEDDAPLIIGSCLPNEKHEIPLQIILLTALLQGWRTIMLGPSPAPNAIEAAVKQLNPSKVILSSITTIPFEMDSTLLSALDKFANDHPHIQFYLGGVGAIHYTQDKPLTSIKVTNEIKDILQES